MSTMYLPTNKNWFKYIKNCRNAYDDSQYILKNILEKTANEACEFIEYKKYHSIYIVLLKILNLLKFKILFQSNDPWLFSLDWTRKEIKINKKIGSNDNGFLDKVLSVPNGNNLFFKTLCEKEKNKVDKTS